MLYLRLIGLLPKVLPMVLLKNLITAWKSADVDELEKVSIKFDYKGKKRSDNQDIWPIYKK